MNNKFRPLVQIPDRPNAPLKKQAVFRIKGSGMEGFDIEGGLRRLEALLARGWVVVNSVRYEESLVYILEKEMRCEEANRRWKLLKAFPTARFDVTNGLALDDFDPSFSIDDAIDETDLKAKVLGYFTRKSFMHYDEGEARNRVHRGINDYLGTQFSYSDFETICLYLSKGDGIDDALARDFVDSGYRMNVLREEQ